MLLTKTARLPFPVDRLEFFVTEEERREGQDTVFTRSLFVAHECFPDGLRLILKQDLIIGLGGNLQPSGAAQAAN